MTKADSPKPPTKLQTITLKVFIHCEGCRRKVRRIIRVLDGVEDVTVDAASGKVTVTGTADVKTILQRLQKYGKHAEMWPSPTPAPSTAGKAGANQPKSNNNSSDSNNKKKNNGGVEGGEKAAAAATEIESKKGDGKDAMPGTTAKGEVAAVSESKPEKSKEGNVGDASDGKMVMQNGGGGGGGGSKKGGKKGGNGNNTNSGGGGGGNNSGGGGGGNNSGGGGGSGGGIGNVMMQVPLPGPPIHDIPIMSAPNTSVVVSANKSLSPYDSIQTGYTYHSAEYATHMFSDENANNCSIM